jgi:hypothetical protein
MITLAIYCLYEVLNRLMAYYTTAEMLNTMICPSVVQRPFFE